MILNFRIRSGLKRPLSPLRKPAGSVRTVPPKAACVLSDTIKDISWNGMVMDRQRPFFLYPGASVIPGGIPMHCSLPVGESSSALNRNLAAYSNSELLAEITALGHN